MPKVDWKRLFLRAFQAWNEDNAGRLAASFSFFAILSLAPLLILAVVVAGHIFSEETARREILREASNSIGRGGAEFLGTMLTNAQKPGSGTIATLISLAVALYGASNLFAQLFDAVNTMWGVVPPQGSAIRNFFVQKIASIVGAFVFILLILAWLVVDSVMGAINRQTGGFPGGQILSLVVSTAFLALVFAASFRSLPQGMVAWGDVWIAAITTAILFSLAKFALGLYFSLARPESAYGPAGALVVILLYTFYSAQIYFYGVELTYVYSHEYGSQKHRKPVVHYS